MRPGRLSGRDSLLRMVEAEPFANLPELTTVLLRFRAEVEQRLPPLPTTAFHGTLGHALRELACLAPERKDCPDCPHLPLCPYAVLFEPRPVQDAGNGVTNRAPPPIVIAPEEPIAGRDPVVLRSGDVLTVRLSLVGSLVRQHLALIVAAMKKAGARGIGLPLEERVRSMRKRPPLRLDEVQPLDLDAAPLANRVQLRFTTPVRIKHDGKILGRLEAIPLYAAMTRRADLLSRLYGTGPVALAAAPPFAIAASEMRMLGVRRYSTRQRQRIDMPGQIGWVELEGDLPSITPLLRFLERVQMGKATTFGLGRFIIEDAARGAE
ncbi:MAG: CRISPR system precrRNA processing endoribonuclease RAMP protein Cas6 [Myxococcota bacterium]